MASIEIKRGTAGAVLYNGERRFTAREVRIFNPLQVAPVHFVAVSGLL